MRYQLTISDMQTSLNTVMKKKIFLYPLVIQHSDQDNFS